MDICDIKTPSFIFFLSQFKASKMRLLVQYFKNVTDKKNPPLFFKKKGKPFTNKILTNKAMSQSVLKM